MSLSPVGQGPQSPELTMPSIRMKLENTFATMQEDGKSSNMKVFARVRPMLQREEDEGYRECVGVIDEHVVRAIVPTTSVKYKNLAQNNQEIYEDFTYSRAFGPEIGQFVFFRQTIMDIMQGFIEGQNCLIFSYGITNSGKTFTLQGDEANPGVIPLAMRLFFASIKHQLLDGISVKPDKFADILMLKDKESDNEAHLKEQLIQLSEQESINKTNSSGNLTKSFASNWCDCFNDDFEFETETTLPPEEMKAAQSALYMKELSKQSADQQTGLCSIWVSFVEIYNEYIYDLLQPNILNRAKLMLGEDQNGDVYVKGAREICVSSSDEALKLLKLGRKNLRIAATKLNYQSSRSHCIFTVKVVRLYDEENGRVNRISFCDLAGSERAAKSQTSGVHLKEAGYINTSILVLGKCLEQLRLNQGLRDKKMIPLRESKLTRLFSGHFLGKGRAVMIANASPCEYTFDETLNVLRFSALLKTVILNDSYLSTVSNSLQNITNQWSKSRAHLTDISHNESADMDSSLWEDIQEREEMIDKLLDLADSLRNNLEKEKKEKAELEYKIRKEVCEEYSANSDLMLENQKRISAEYIDSLNEIHKKRVTFLEKMYEQRISELTSQLQEYDSCTDESSMSINKGNSTLDVEDAENSNIIFSSPCVKAEKAKFIFASPLTVVKEEIDQVKDKCDAESSPAVALPLQSAVHNQMEEIKSLQISLELVTKELETAKEELELSSEKLKTAQTEAAMVIEECESLRLKLQNAEAEKNLEIKNTKEIDFYKSESLKKDIEIESLKKEKISLEENILFLSEEISAARSEIDQLKNDKTKTEECYAEQIEQLQQKIAIADEHCKDLNQKLEDCNKCLREEITKNTELESMCMTINNDKTKLEKEKEELEEKICCILKQSDNDVKLKCQKLNKQLEDVNKVVQEQETNISQLEKTCEALKRSNSELSKDLEMEKEKHKALSEKHGMTDLKCQDLTKQLEAVDKIINDQKTHIIHLEEDCTALKSENTILASDYNIEKEEWTSLSKEHDLFVTQGKDELLNKLEEHNAKISKVESDCAKYETQNKQLLETIKKLEEECAMLTDKHDLTLKEKCSEAGVQLENTLQKLDEQKLKNSSLEEKCSDLSLQLDNTLQEQKEKILKIGNLENKIEDLNTHIENMNNIISELKLQVSTLELECSSHKSNHAELLEDYNSLEEKFGCMKEKLGTKEDDSDLKTEVEKLKAECDMHKSSYDKVYENYQAVEIAFAALTKDIGLLRLDYDQLKEVKLAEEEEHNQYVKELLERSESYTKEVEELKKKLDETQIKATTYENEIEQFNSVCKAHTEKLSQTEAENAVLKDKIEEISATDKEATEVYTEKIAKLEKSISEKEDRIKVLTDAVQTQEDCNAELKQKEIDIESYKREIANLKDELKKAKLMQEKMAKLEDICSQNEEAMKKSTEKITELEKSISEKECKIKELTESVQTLENYKNDIQNKEIDIASYKEEIANLKSELKEAKLLQEQSDLLCESLQKCELLASNKIKMLTSSSIKHLDEITDMRRQIKEKNSSIGELEKALCDSQKQVKEMDAKITKQVAAKRQDASRIEQIQHQKKLLDAENAKLKLSLQQAELKNKEEQENIERAVDKAASNKAQDADRRSTEEKDEAKRSSNTSKGRKKRSLSDANKETDVKVENKENCKRTNKVQEKKPTKATKASSVNTEENDTLPKRRRILRAQQATVADISDDSFEIKLSDDDEYAPMQKTALRKKKTTKVAELTKQRTSRRKLQEQENMSPVKKAMQFVGSKIRSVAQSVSNMPSPRVTRGRKKLFNADAVPKAEPKWRP